MRWTRSRACSSQRRGVTSSRAACRRSVSAHLPRSARRVQQNAFCNRHATCDARGVMREIQPTEQAVNGHAVQFYERESYLLDSVTEYIGSALSTASAGILIATPAHRDGVAQR